MQPSQGQQESCTDVHMHAPLIVVTPSAGALWTSYPEIGTLQGWGLGRVDTQILSSVDML